MTDFDRFVFDAPPFRTAGWNVDPVSLRATRGKEERRLEPKLIGVLCVLAQRQGEVVTRQELFDTIWSGTLVSDDNLTRAISMLRRLFGDTAQEQRVIETVPRIGYRLLASVEWETGTPAVGGDSLPAPPDLVVPEVDRPPQARWTLGLGVGLAVLTVLGVWVARGGISDASVRPIQTAPVTSAHGLEMSASLSPDGTRVAYVQSAEDAMDLVVSDIDGQTPITLLTVPGVMVGINSSPLWSPAWSPDGETLAFVQREGGTCTIRTIAALGGPPRTLRPCGHPDFASLDWTPDGRYVVTEAVTEVAGGSTLGLVDVATGDLAPLPLERPAGPMAYQPRVSPDGSRILFRRLYPSGGGDLFVFDRSTTRTERLTDVGSLVTGADWISDDEVLYSAAAEGSMMIRETRFWRLRLDAPEREPTWVPIGPGSRVATSGHDAVFERWMLTTELSSVDLDTADRQPFAASTAYDAFPQWSPDGQRVAFLSDRSGVQMLWTSAADGTRARPMVGQMHAAESPPRWSPDGRRLAFTAVDGATKRVFVLDAEGAVPRPLTDPGRDAFHPAWSADGRWLYFTTTARTGRREIWRVPVGGGVAEPVTQGVLAQGSPDGRWLYVVKDDSAGLWREPMGGGRPERLTPALALDSPFSWHPHADGVYVIEVDDGRAALVTLTNDGTRRVEGPVGDHWAAYGFAVSPDGNHVLAWSVSMDAADLVRAKLPVRR